MGRNTNFQILAVTMSSSPLDSSSDSSTLEMTSLMDVLPAPGVKPEPESPVKVQLKAVRQVQAEVARPIKKEKTIPTEASPAPLPMVGPGLPERAEVVRPTKFPAEEPAPVPMLGPGLAERAMELRREECRLLGARERAGRGGQGEPGLEGQVEEARARLGRARDNRWVGAPSALPACRI